MDHIIGDLPGREKTVRQGSVKVVKGKDLCIHTVPDLLKSSLDCSYFIQLTQSSPLVLGVCNR